MKTAIVFLSLALLAYSAYANTEVNFNFADILQGARGCDDNYNGADGEISFKDTTYLAFCSGPDFSLACLRLEKTVNNLLSGKSTSIYGGISTFWLTSSGGEIVNGADATLETVATYYSSDLALLRLTNAQQRAFAKKSPEGFWISNAFQDESQLYYCAKGPGGLYDIGCAVQLQPSASAFRLESYGATCNINNANDCIQLEIAVEQAIANGGSFNNTVSGVSLYSFNAAGSQLHKGQLYTVEQFAALEGTDLETLKRTNALSFAGVEASPQGFWSFGVFRSEGETNYCARGNTPNSYVICSTL